MHPVLFRLPNPFGDPWPLHLYGVLIVTGFLVGMYLAWREAKRHHEMEEEVLDFAFWGLIGGLIGARVVFILVNWEVYAANPLQIFVIWKGGLVFYGAFLGGVTALLIYVRKMGYDLRTSLKLADYVVIGVPMGQVFGRFGCMAAGCCWGMHAYHMDGGSVVQDIPLAARFPAAHDGQPASLAYASLIDTVPPEMRQQMVELGTTLPLIPSQLLESFGASLIVLTLIVVRSRKWFHGQVTLTYAMLYALMRFGLEFMRGDAARGVAVLSTSQFIALGVSATCVALLIYLRKRGLAQAAAVPSS